MRRRVLIPVLVFLLLGLSVSFAWQRGGGRRQSFGGGWGESYLGSCEGNPAPIPPDADEKTEFVWARLRYPGYGGRGGGCSWGTDYPKNDRQFLQGVRRLTILNARSMEHVVDLDSDDIFKYPMIYAVEVGAWQLNDSQAQKLREYFDRGGFLMVDDFHGENEWLRFMFSLSKVFPDRAVVEIDSKDPIFHVLYDLDERYQIPGLAALRAGVTYERYDGVVPHWRGVYDDKGRLQVAITFNQDLGDAWEWADDPGYPVEYASQAYQIGINNILYAMTH